MVRAVFLDRDGTINELVEHDGQPTAPWAIGEFKFLPGVKEAVNKIKEAGYNIYVVTNQPDLNDGKLSYKDLQLMNKMIERWLGIDNIYCAYDRNAMNYKPNTGMIEHFIKRDGIKPHKSYIVGDRWKDIVPGHRCMLTTIFLGKTYTTPTEYEHIRPDYIVPNLLDAAKIITEWNE